MIAVDTSVIVAAFSSWHERHALAVEALAAGARLPGHCALEAMSVLTRLPAPHRASGTIVRDFLAANFTAPPLVLDAAALLALIRRLPELGIVGGGVYDALVGATAAAAGHELVTLDARAGATYGRLGVVARQLAE